MSDVDRQWQKDVDKVIPRKERPATEEQRHNCAGPRCFISEDVHIAVVAAGTAAAQWHLINGTVAAMPSLGRSCRMLGNNTWAETSGSYSREAKPIRFKEFLS